MEEHELKFFECNQPDCGFAIQAKNEDEILEYAVEHAKSAHNLDLVKSMQKFFSPSN